MARNYATSSTAVWRQDGWRALRMDEQHVHMMLGSQPNITAVGTLPLTVKRWAQLAADFTVDGLMGTIRRLQAAGWVVVDEETEEILVRSFLEDDKGYSNPKRRPTIREAATEVASPAIQRALRAEFGRLGLPTDWLPDSPSDSPPPGYPVGHAENSSKALGWAKVPTSVIPIVDIASPQANNLSDSQPDGISPEQRDEGCGYGSTSDTASHIPQSSSLIPNDGRSPTHRLIMGLVQADDDEAELVIKTIEERHKPRSVSAYVRAMATEDLRELLAELRRKHRAAPPALPPPCGECGPNRMVATDDDRAARCPRCHPLAVKDQAS